MKAARGTDALESLVLATSEGEVEVPCDLLVVASGFSGCDAVDVGLAAEVEVEAGMFGASDMAPGAALVVDAIPDARCVAAQVDRRHTGFTSI